MSCSHYEIKDGVGMCRNGFVVMGGCYVTGKLEERLINNVWCGGKKEEMAGRIYFENGGLPPGIKLDKP